MSVWGSPFTLMYPKHKAKEARHLEMTIGTDNQSPEKNLLSLVKEIRHSRKIENFIQNHPPPRQTPWKKLPVSLPSAKAEWETHTSILAYL